MFVSIHLVVFYCLISFYIGLCMCFRITSNAIDSGCLWLCTLFCLFLMFVSMFCIAVRHHMLLCSGLSPTIYNNVVAEVVAVYRSCLLAMDWC